MSHPTKIDRYEIRDVLGTGAMGCVYSAWDPKLHRNVALKVVTLDLSRHPKARDRFLREVRAVATLRHPNVVEVYDYSGPESRQLFLVMEKLEGDDLFNIVEDNGGMPEPVAAAVAHELCSALGAAHEQGIIHRDLKPENVFIDLDGRVVLTDFGIVKAVRENSAVDGFDKKTDVIGTPGFMAPELMMNKPLGPYTDVFALGALLYNITTGKLPYDGAGPVDIFKLMMAAKYDDPRDYNVMLSDDFCDCLREMLEPKPKRRMGSMADVRDEMKKVLAQNGVTDLREDLREYMSDARAYARSAKRRKTSRLLEQIKIATKDRDAERAEKLRSKLLRIDPDNSEIYEISGVMTVDTTGDEPGLTHRPVTARQDRPQSRPTGRRSGRKLGVVAALLMIGAVLAAAYLVMRPRELTAPEKVPATPVEAAAGKVDIVVKGGAGVIFVDGERVAKGRKHSIELPPGEHTIEVRGKRNRLKKTVSVAKNGKFTVVAELRRGKITTEPPQ